VRAMAEAARDGHVVRRDQLVRTGRHFIGQFRTVLGREENELFPLLYESLRRSDWVEISTQCRSFSHLPAEPRDDDGFTTVTGNLVCPRSHGTNAVTQWSGSSRNMAEARRGDEP
jgi:hemerythrin-like domain-containing protein